MTNKIQPILMHLQGILQNPLKILPECLVLGISISLSILLVWGLKRTFKTASHKTKGHFSATMYQLLESSFSPLIGYLFLLLSLSLAEYLFGFFKYETGGLKFAFHMVLSIIIGKGFASIAKRPRVGVGIGSIVALYFIIDRINPLSGVFGFLDAIAFNMAGTRFSILSIAKDTFWVFLVVWVTTKLSASAHESIKSARKIRVSSKELISKLTDIGLYSVAFIIVLKIIGIDITTLAVVGGGISVGIGFGLQKISSNFISGMILVYEKSIEIGDLLEVDATTLGWVKKLGARYTLVEAFDGREVMVPNEDFMTNRVTSWTFSNKMARIEISFMVEYRSDANKVIDIAIAAAKNHPETIKDQLPSCFLREFADNGIRFELCFFIKDVTYGRKQAQSDVMLALWNTFKEEGIEVPYPQQEVHLLQNPKPKK